MYLIKPTNKPSKKKLYLAYGSNLNVGQMKYRCPLARPVYSGVLADWKLVFRNVADIVEEQGASVAVGIWEITEQCEKALDAYEGYPTLYGKRTVELPNPTRDGTLTCMTYTMNRGAIGAPSLHYFATILQGYRNFDLDVSSLAQARNHAIENDSYQERFSFE